MAHDQPVYSGPRSTDRRIQSQVAGWGWWKPTHTTSSNMWRRDQFDGETNQQTDKIDWKRKLGTKQKQRDWWGKNYVVPLSVDIPGEVTFPLLKPLLWRFLVDRIGKSWDRFLQRHFLMARTSMTSLWQFLQKKNARFTCECQFFDDHDDLQSKRKWWRAYVWASFWIQYIVRMWC